MKLDNQNRDLPKWANTFSQDLDFLPLGRLVYLRNEKNDPIKLNQILSLTADRGVILYEEKGAVGNQASEDISRYSIVRKGDIVVNSMNVIIGSVGLSKYDGVLSPIYYVLKPFVNGCIDMRYLAYHFQIPSFQKSLIRIGYGILDHRMRIPWINLKSEIIALPSILAQKNIANKLDQITGDIDSIVKEKILQITLLEELETSYISRKMESQDNIPMKFLCLGGGQYGLNVEPEEYTTSGIRLLRTSDFGSRNVEPIYLNSTVPRRYIAQEGDILFSRSGTVGESFYVNTELADSTFAGFLVRFRVNPEKCLSRYLYFATKTLSFKSEISLGSVTSTISNFNGEKYEALKIPNRDLDEQSRVVAEIENMIKESQQRISLIKTSIQLLIELRAAVVTEAITSAGRSIEGR